MDNPDELLHVFSTFMGLPADTDTPPVCGAQLTSAYNGKGKPHCEECDRILAEWKAKKASGK
jgi:hypothetical protein